MKICNKFTEEHLCRSVIAIKLLWNFIKTTFRHRYCSINLLHIFRTPFPKNTSGGLLLNINGVLSISYELFHDSPARSADYTEITGNNFFPKKGCRYCEVKNASVAQRALDIYEDVNKYLEK